MIYIVHGENVPTSREFLLRLQQEQNVGSKKEFNILDVSLGDLMDHVSSVDMFGSIPMIVFDVTKMGRMSVDNYINAIKEVPRELVFVVFSEKNLSKTNPFIKGSQNLDAKVMGFKKSQKANVFRFVDSILDDNRVSGYKELRKLILVGDDPIYIFSMLVYGLRNIGYDVFKSPSFEKLAPFVKLKAGKQAANFTTKEVADLYEYFYVLDRDVKFGLVSPEMLVPLAIEKVLKK